jgi:hypothetical protein
MKEMLLLAFPRWGRGHTHGKLKDKVCPHYQVSPRRALQTLGTDWGRALGESLWVNATLDTLPEGHTVICDVRFPNEVEAIQARGGKVIRLRRGEAAVWDRWDMAAIGEASCPHYSETALLDYTGFDYTIDNTGTLETYYTALKGVLESIHGE